MLTELLKIANLCSEQALRMETWLKAGKDHKDFFAQESEIQCTMQISGRIMQYTTVQFMLNKLI